MEYIDFTKKKIELHKEIENAIKNMMTEKGVTEIDLTQDEEHYDAGWVIRRVENASNLKKYRWHTSSSMAIVFSTKARVLGR